MVRPVQIPQHVKDFFDATYERAPEREFVWSRTIFDQLNAHLAATQMPPVDDGMLGKYLKKHFDTEHKKKRQNGPPQGACESYWFANVSPVLTW